MQHEVLLESIALQTTLHLILWRCSTSIGRKFCKSFPSSGLFQCLARNSFVYFYHATIPRDRIARLHGFQTTDGSRQKARLSIIPSYEAYFSDGMSLASLAEKLPSYHTLYEPTQSKVPLRQNMLVRPKTEVSRLGMERWLATVEKESSKSEMGPEILLQGVDQSAANHAQSETLTEEMRS